MTQTCAKCGEIIGEGKKFCPACGAKVENEPKPQITLTLQEQPDSEQTNQTNQTGQTEQPKQSQQEDKPNEPKQNYTPPPIYTEQVRINTSPDADAKPPKGSKYAPISTIGYIFLMIGMALPVIGFILMLVFAFGGGNVNRRNYARALLFFLIIGLIVAIVGTVLFWSTISQLTENIDISWGF